VFASNSLRSQQFLVMASLVTLACLIGAAIPLYILVAGEGVVKLLALPAAVVLGYLFFFARKLLFVLIMVSRATINPIIETARFAPFLGLGAALNALMILMAILLALERPRGVLRAVVPIWLPLVAVMVVAALRAPELSQGVRTFMSYMTYVAAFAVPFCMKECQKDMRFCIRLILVSSLIPCLYGFFDFAVNACGRGDNRICSTFEHPNIYAFYLVTVISLVFYMLKSSLMRITTSQRWMLAAYMGILMVLLLLTKTRSAWAACIVMFVVYGLLFERRYLVYVAVVGAIALLFPVVQERLTDLESGPRFWTAIPGNSYEWRKMIWESAWNWMAPNSLVLGYGLDSFTYHSVEFFNLAYGIRRGAHNVYMQWLFETGIVGLLCAAWLYFRIFALLRRGMKHDRLGTAIVITVMAEYLVISYSDNMLGYLAFNWYYWFVLGTACAIVMEQEARSAEPGAKVGVSSGGPPPVPVLSMNRSPQ
jgi:O-antigen ligase